MDITNLTKFLLNNIEPSKDEIYGNRYRAAAKLKDGTYLPCVVFQSAERCVELALRRFKETSKKPSEHRMVVESFVACGSRLADYEIASIEPSIFAWPHQILKQIHGETVMSWTAFVAEMKDGTMHSYGTSFHFEFFALPKGYSYDDIARIHSGCVYSPTRGLQSFSLDALKELQIYREKPFFTCFVKAHL